MKSTTFFLGTVLAFGVLTFILQSSTVGGCDALTLDAGHSGAPSEVNWALCHSRSVNSGLGIVDFDMGMASNLYVPGQKYTASLTITESGVAKFCFQVTAIKDSEIQPMIGN